MSVTWGLHYSSEVAGRLPGYAYNIVHSDRPDDLASLLDPQTILLSGEPTNTSKRGMVEWAVDQARLRFDSDLHEFETRVERNAWGLIYVYHSPIVKKSLEAVEAAVKFRGSIVIHREGSRWGFASKLIDKSEDYLFVKKGSKRVSEYDVSPDEVLFCYEPGRALKLANRRKKRPLKVKTPLFEVNAHFNSLASIVHGYFAKLGVDAKTYGDNGAQTVNKTYRAIKLMELLKRINKTALLSVEKSNIWGPDSVTVYDLVEISKKAKIRDDTDKVFKDSVSLFMKITGERHAKSPRKSSRNR